MNHEFEAYEQLPTVRHLFHEGGEVAILLGDIHDIHNEHEDLRQFVVEKFPADVKKRWPELQSVTYTPSYMVEDSLSDDMLWVTLSDDVVRRDYILTRDLADNYSVEVEYSAAERTDTREVSETEKAATRKAIDYMFNDLPYDTEVDIDQVEKLDFLLRQDRTATPIDIMMLGEIFHALSVHSKE